MGGLVRTKCPLDPGPGVVRHGLCPAGAPGSRGCPSLAWLSAAAGCCLLGELLNTDYGAFGVLLCLLFYCTHGLRRRFWICGGCSCGCATHSSLSSFREFRYLWRPWGFCPSLCWRSPGPPELPAAPGSVWVLLVLPFAHAAFSPLQLGRGHVTDCNGAQKGKRQTYPGGNWPRPVCSLLLPGPDGLQREK